MAIEFNCPNCSALIRVPDNAAGGKGKCPRCASRIKVPKVSSRSAPKPPSPELEGLFASPEPEEVVPNTPDTSDAVVFAEAEPEFDPSSAVDFLSPAPRQLGQLPVETSRPALRPGSVASRLKKKKSGGAWLIPLAFGLLLCGVVGWYVWQQYQTEILSGQLSAETASALELPAVEISNSMFRQSPDEMKAVLEELEESPVRIPSSLMLVQIGATKRSVSVRVNAGPQTMFYRVDTQGDAALAKYRKTNTLQLEQTREAELEEAATQFATEYQRVKAKKVGPSALNDFRNTLALPALVRGLGHQVVAVYGQTIYRCAYEDREGGLYFLLPPGAQAFELIGYKDQGGKTAFPGKYQVKVTGEMKIPVKEEPKSPDKKKSKKVESMDDSDKPEMSESMDDGDMKKPKPKN